MKQVPLKIRTKLSYSANDFIIHDGVKAIVDDFIPCFQKPGFFVGYIYGAKRQGKTHLSVYLAEKLAKEGGTVLLWEGKIESISQLSERVILIIDDAQNILIQGQEGRFVELFEKIKILQGKLILLSDTKRDNIKCDDHVMSRLRQSHYEVIGILSPEDSEPMIRYIAFQRGIQLTSRKSAALAKQITRDIRVIEEFLTPS